MKIKNEEFANVFASSGTLNFFGDGWWYHFFFKILFPGFKKLYTDASFISKTTTWWPRAGNMRLRDNLQTRSLMPKCIKFWVRRGIALNAVNLSGPGALKLFAADKWQKFSQPFLISFMAIGGRVEERLEETRRFVQLFQLAYPGFQAPAGIQLNKSCPNTGHKTADLEQETIETLKLFSGLGVPIDLKVNIFFGTNLLREIAAQGLCDCITVSNTIPFGAKTPYLDWEKLFPAGQSPLKQYGGGGLSGKVLLPAVVAKIVALRQAGVTIPIKGSGGIMSARDVMIMKAAGADGIEFAIAAMIRPWRVKEIIETAEKIFTPKT